MRIAEERGVASSFSVISRATSDCEEGNPIYPPAGRELAKRGYDGFSHRARTVTMSELVNADYVLVMDEINLRDLTAFTCGNCRDKIFKLGSFLPVAHDIDDPWYTNDFARAYDEIYHSCEAFLSYLQATRPDLFAYDGRH